MKYGYQKYRLWRISFFKLSPRSQSPKTESDAKMQVFGTRKIVLSLRNLYSVATDKKKNYISIVITYQPFHSELSIIEIGALFYLQYSMVRACFCCILAPLSSMRCEVPVHKYSTVIPRVMSWNFRQTGFLELVFSPWFLPIWAPYLHA